MYDAIILGGRVAGSPTAMLLAQKGYRVLLVDRATFPSDTLSTHQIQIPGSLMLKKWGLLDKVLATKPGGAHHIRIDLDKMVLESDLPTVDGINSVYCPRRYMLDQILLDAAVAAGVEVRQGFIAEGLLWEDDHVCGIRGRLKAGGPIVMEHARMVIGADGKHSLVANAVNARKYDEYPALTCGYYSYWAGIRLNGGEMYERGRRLMGVWPTNDNLTLIYTAWPAAEFDRYRADVEGNYLATIDLVPKLAERVHQGRRVEKIRGSGDMLNFYRKPYGPGWALVGDAGYTKDPITGLGISDAFRDAELLAEALDAGFAGRQPLELALKGYEQQRNNASLSAYETTLETARMDPPGIVQIELFKALQANSAAASEYFGVFAGVVKAEEFFTPQHLFHIIGMRGTAKIIVNKVFHHRHAG